MGLWVVNELRRCMCPDMPFDEITKMASESKYEEVVDVNNQDFLSPDNMKDCFDLHLSNKPNNMADYFRCAYKSLAVCYKKAIEQLENNTNKEYKDLYIVGGGAKKQLLNDLTKEYTGKNVIALPIEATSIGNLKVQMEGDM